MRVTQVRWTVDGGIPNSVCCITLETLIFRDVMRRLSIFCSLILLNTLEAAPVDFVKEVRPIFESHCYDCHGEDKQK